MLVLDTTKLWSPEFYFHLNLGQALYNFLDKGSGQTFAQAFDAVAMALRTGTTVTPQPWFENQVPGGTLVLAKAQRAGFIDGNVASVFLSLDLARMSQGLPPFQNYMSQVMSMRSTVGTSCYNAGTITLRKRFAGTGLMYDLSYTLSKVAGSLGRIQPEQRVAHTEQLRP